MFNSMTFIMTIVTASLQFDAIYRVSAVGLTGNACAVTFNTGA
jgi:hypothetical protein